MNDDDDDDDDDDTLIVIGRRQTDIMTYSLASSFVLAVLAPPLRSPFSMPLPQ